MGTQHDQQSKAYTICVICNDDRANKWAFELLQNQSDQTPHLDRVYAVRSEHDHREFLMSGEMEANVLFQGELPTSFDAIFFHSSNYNLWQLLNLTVTYVFEFNTPGDPPQREGVIRILRQTAPYFDIKLDDIQQLVDFITGTRQEIPDCCLPPVQQEVLPALTSLCQGYLAASADASCWQEAGFWQTALGYKPLADSSQRYWQDCYAQLEREWRSMGGSAITQHIQQLWNAVTTAADQLITTEIVVAAYGELADLLGLPTAVKLTMPQPQMLNSVLAFVESPASQALATVLSQIWHLPHHPLQSTEEPVNWSLLSNSLLIITEPQIKFLKQLRQKGFRGAVLVVSSDSFQQLKQRHRVLRFGQGSHAAFSAPWDLHQLLPTLAEMQPLAAGNLDYLQKEMRSSQKLYEKRIAPCLQRLQQWEREETPHIKPDDLTDLEDAISKIRSDLPIPCHAISIVKLPTEADDRRQVQEHLQQGLKELKSQNTQQINRGIRRFEQVFSHLKSSVIEAW